MEEELAARSKIVAGFGISAIFFLTRSKSKIVLSSFLYSKIVGTVCGRGSCCLVIAKRVYCTYTHFDGPPKYSSRREAARKDRKAASQGLLQIRDFEIEKTQLGHGSMAFRSPHNDKSYYGAPNNANRVDTSYAWLDTIQEATASLRTRSAEDYDTSLFYLQRLEGILLGSGDNLDQPPRGRAPSWHAFCLLSRPEQQHHPAVGENLVDSDEENTGDIVMHTMDARRLLIRILTSQSEVYAAQALQLRHAKQWMAGAQLYTCSLAKIHQAIELADSKICQWLQHQQPQSSSPHSLVQDASIVQVAIESLTTGRDKYLMEAEKLQASILRQLEPQWKSRDDAKARMGNTKWHNNPAPKYDYAAKRRDLEAQLRDVQAAVKHLMSVDTTAAQAAAELWNQQLGTDGSSSQTSQRYNGLRPTDYSKRVSWEDYPDPTRFGWDFTGSVGNTTEFFEKDNVKLDWYFTTATIKTSLDHPKQQRKTQLFGNKVDPDTYIKILTNPRVHTGDRYHTKPKKNKQPKRMKQRRPPSS